MDGDQTLSRSPLYGVFEIGVAAGLQAGDGVKPVAYDQTENAIGEKPTPMFNAAASSCFDVGVGMRGSSAEPSASRQRRRFR